MFGYRVEGGLPVYDFGENGLATLRVNPGLSTFADDPNEAGGSLRKLIEFGKGRIPKEHWGDTEIRLMATAGLRLLDSELQERILQSCRLFLRSSGFKFTDDRASVITGKVSCLRSNLIKKNSEKIILYYYAQILLCFAL